MNTYTYAYKQAFARASMCYPHVYMHPCVLAHIHACVFACTSTYIHTYRNNIIAVSSIRQKNRFEGDSTQFDECVLVCHRKGLPAVAQLTTNVISLWQHIYCMYIYCNGDSDWSEISCLWPLHDMCIRECTHTHLACIYTRIHTCTQTQSQHACMSYAYIFTWNTHTYRVLSRSPSLYWRQMERNICRWAHFRK